MILNTERLDLDTRVVRFKGCSNLVLTEIYQQLFDEDIQGPQRRNHKDFQFFSGSLAATDENITVELTLAG